MDCGGTHFDEALVNCFEASVVELQKKKALPSLKGLSVGMKLKLHSFAIAKAVLSSSGVRSAQSQITAFSHIVGCGL